MSPHGMPVLERIADGPFRQPKYIWTPFGRKASPAAHYQWTVCVCALISSGALFSVAISVIQLRNGFASALTSIEAIAPDLKTDTGSSFSQLVSKQFSICQTDC